MKIKCVIFLQSNLFFFSFAISEIMLFLITCSKINKTVMLMNPNK